MSDEREEWEFPVDERVEMRIAWLEGRADRNHREPELTLLKAMRAALAAERKLCEEAAALIRELLTIHERSGHTYDIVGWLARYNASREQT